MFVLWAPTCVNGRKLSLTVNFDEYVTIVLELREKQQQFPMYS